MFAHLVAGVIMLTFEILHRYNIQPIMSGAVTSLLVSFLYILMIIYVIWKNRMLVTDISDYDSTFCDSLIEGWLRFEVRVSLMWIVSTMVFLLYSLLFKFQSKWKYIEETLGLQKIWNTKGAQDYLHYMRIEQENMNLVLAPFFCSLFSFARNERVGNNWLDYFVLASFLLTRTLVVLGFLFHL